VAYVLAKFGRISGEGLGGPSYGPRIKAHIGAIFRDPLYGPPKGARYRASRKPYCFGARVVWGSAGLAECGWAGRADRTRGRTDGAVLVGVVGGPFGKASQIDKITYASEKTRSEK